MQSAIWKIEIPFAVQQVIAVAVPAGSELLCVKWHDGKVTGWFKFPLPTTSVEARKFRIFATGEKFDEEEGLLYVTTLTVPKPEFTFIWHVFEVLE